GCHKATAHYRHYRENHHHKYDFDQSETPVAPARVHLEIHLVGAKGKGLCIRRIYDHGYTTRMRVGQPQLAACCCYRYGEAVACCASLRITMEVAHIIIGAIRRDAGTG